VSEKKKTPGVSKLPNGRWQARARTGGRGSRRPGKTFDRKSDAVAWKQAMDRRRQLGDVDVDGGAGRVQLNDFIATYWQLHAIPNLEASTRAGYKTSWVNHIRPRLGTYQLNAITPAVVNNFRAKLLAAGVGEPTVRKALTVLQSILTLAKTQGHLRGENPVAQVAKPSQAPSRQRVPVPVPTIELIRHRLLARRTRALHVGTRDALLVALMAYAGLRPQEALGLHWQDVGTKSLMIEWKVVFGELIPWTKTKGTRPVPLWPALADDLRAWRLASGTRTGLVFGRANGKPWQLADYNNWRRRIYQPAAQACGLAGPIPYDLRATWVSLMVYEGHNLLEVARYAGHSLGTMEAHYARIFEDYDPADRVSAQEQIRTARVKLAEDANQLRLKGL
jgi:integrase